MLVCIKLYKKTHIKIKTIGFLHVNEVSFVTMPSSFDKTSINTWKNNGYFSRGPLQGVTSSSLIN